LLRRGYAAVVKRLHCADLGFACDHILEQENEEELLEAAEQHALLEHGVALDDAAREELKAAIRTA
jgi:predicted small metal-binding protein